MITVLITDDESHARERLKDLLSRFDCFEIIAEAQDGNEALSKMITLNPDVAFLDINMPGISVFQSLPSLKEPPLIVFQTAYSEHAAEAFDIDAVDYLLKPVRFERLEKCVQKLLKKIASKKNETELQPQNSLESTDRISVKTNGKIKLIDTSDIIRISFERGFSTIFTETEQYMSDKYLNYFEEKLREKRFFRASRTELVNLGAISVIENLTHGLYEIELINGMTVDLSRRKAQALRKIMDF